jgi:hypothetical protein
VVVFGSTKILCARLSPKKLMPRIREVETGKGADALERRPELAAAMKFARRLGKSFKHKPAFMFDGFA